MERHARVIALIGSLVVFGYIAGHCLLAFDPLLAFVVLIPVAMHLPMLAIGLCRRQWVRSLSMPRFLISLVPNASMSIVLATHLNFGSLKASSWLAVLCLLPGVLFWPFAWNIVRRIEYDCREARRHKRRQQKRSPARCNNIRIPNGAEFTRLTAPFVACPTNWDRWRTGTRRSC